VRRYDTLRILIVLASLRHHQVKIRRTALLRQSGTAASFTVPLR
jgi:hypothetical protein